MKFLSTLRLFSAFLMMFSIFGKDIDLGTNSTVLVKIMGQSGKISLKDKNSTEEVIIDFSTLSEKDEKGVEVGKSGSSEHIFNNFTQLNFTFSDISETKYQNLSVIKVTMTASNLVDPETSFIGTVLLFMEQGQIDMGNGEKADVIDGSLKLNFDFSAWPFCEDPCTGSHCCKANQTNEVGKYLDFQVAIKGNKTAVKDSSNFDLGNSKVIIASNVKVDGVWTKMEEGYPKYESDVFTFRFTKFTNTTSYDPIVSFTEPPPRSLWWIVVILIVGVLALGLIAFLIVRCYSKSRADKEKFENSQL